MDGEKKLKAIQEQTDFCTQLMKRISSSITDAKVSEGYPHIRYAGFGEYTFGHTVVSNDIKRLRRELSNLEKMVVNVYE